MKTNMTAACLVAMALLALPAAAESSWWEKAVDIFKKVDTKDVTKDTVTDMAKELTGDPTVAELSAAFKEALQIGADKVVARLGEVDGFNNDPSIHIPLPEELDTVKRFLDKVGMSRLTDDLEVKINRAAEAATPKAKALFVDSIRDMSFEDIKAIYAGPADSATQYFKEKMSPLLQQEIEPIVQGSLSEVGAVQSFDDIIGKYKALPFVPDVKAELTGHVVTRTIDGIFFYMAKEEAAIREDPLKQSTALLKKVFGATGIGK